MKFTLKRALTAGALSVGLVVGSFAMAVPANAATTKIPAVHGSIVVHNHKDVLTFTPATQKQWHHDGEATGIAKSYNITLKDGKKLLFKEKNVGVYRTLYVSAKIGGTDGDKTYKSDRAITKELSKESKVSTAKAKKFVLNYFFGENSNPSRKALTQQSVNSEVTTVQVDIVEGVAIPTGRTNFDHGIYVIVKSAADNNFTVTGYDKKDNYKYTYSSVTGTFKAGKITK